MKRALEGPIRQICSNAGVEASIVVQKVLEGKNDFGYCLLYTSPSPRDGRISRMPSSA